MQRKWPIPRPFLSDPAPTRPVPDHTDDDPWAGEDVDWQAEAERPRGDPATFARFFRALVVAAVVGALFWAGLVLLILHWL